MPCLWGVLRLQIYFQEDLPEQCRSMSQRCENHGLPFSRTFNPRKERQKYSVNRNVVRLHQAPEDEDEVHLVMELYRGVDLFDRLEAVQACHRADIIHPDIKLVTSCTKQKNAISPQGLLQSAYHSSSVVSVNTVDGSRMIPYGGKVCSFLEHFVN